METHPVYAHGSEVEHFADFCRTHLVQSDDRFDGLALELEEFQRQFMSEAMAYDRHGFLMWRSVVLVVARKNGKTHLLSAYAIYRLLTSGGSPEILLAASSDKQAGHLFNAAAKFIRRSVYLSSLCRVRDYTGEIVREDGLGRILRMSSDPKRLHGYNPSLVIADELGEWTTPQLEKAYEALVTGGGARTAPQIFAITTPGDWASRHSSILGRITDAALAAEDQDTAPGLTIGRNWTSRELAYIYEAPTRDRHDIAALKLANPASWITPESLASQAANSSLTDAAMLQRHGCVWAESSESWLPADAWAEQATERVVEDGGRVVLAFDGSYSRDASALIGCTLDGHVFVVKVWERPSGSSDTWRVPRSAVHAQVDAAMERYEVVELACDPPGWHAEIEVWEETYGEVVAMFETKVPARMCGAVDRFRAAVLEETLTHDGDKILARHIANCVAKEKSEGTALAKPAPTQKIDAAVAAVVAFERASWHSNAKPRFRVADQIW